MYKEFIHHLWKTLFCLNYRLFYENNFKKIFILFLKIFEWSESIWKKKIQDKACKIFIVKSFSVRPFFICWLYYSLKIFLESYILKTWSKCILKIFWTFMNLKKNKFIHFFKPSFFPINTITFKNKKQKKHFC